MKNYTIHFLIVTIVSALLGFTGLDFPGATVVRLICLFAGIGLMISCLDSIIISRKRKKAKKEIRIEKLDQIFLVSDFFNKKYSQMVRPATSKRNIEKIVQVLK